MTDRVITFNDMHDTCVDQVTKDQPEVTEYTCLDQIRGGDWVHMFPLGDKKSIGGDGVQMSSSGNKISIGGDGVHMS